MKLTTFVVTLLPAACLAIPFPSGHHFGHGGKKAIYFLRVDPAGSSVVAIEVGSDGKLTDSTSSTSTDGVGQQAQNFTSPTLAPPGADPLQGQNSVTIGEDYLFTINSGSDTAVMFKINPENPLDLTMVGKPASTLGQFTMSIAYSSEHKKACVLNGGAVNGVACYSVSPEQGLIPDGVGLRTLGFSARTPPQLGGPKGSGSDIQFTTDSTKLITTFKGTTKPVALGHVSVFDVSENGDVAATFTDNSMQPLGAPFGFALSQDDSSNLFISDAAFGGVLATLDYATDKISIDSVVNSTKFAASCWAAYSSATGLFYDVDAASTKFGKVNAAGDLIGFIHYDKALGGSFDTAVDGSTLYFLAAVNMVGVIDLESGELVQKFTYSTPANRPFWTGMAFYPSGFGGGFGGGW